MGPSMWPLAGGGEGPRRRRWEVCVGVGDFGAFLRGGARRPTASENTFVTRVCGEGYAGCG
jgi:hypothetical protein